MDFYNVTDAKVFEAGAALAPMLRWALRATGRESIRDVLFNTFCIDIAADKRCWIVATDGKRLHGITVDTINADWCGTYRVIHSAAQKVFAVKTDLKYPAFWQAVPEFQPTGEGVYFQKKRGGSAPFTLMRQIVKKNETNVDYDYYMDIIAGARVNGNPLWVSQSTNVDALMFCDAAKFESAHMFAVVMPTRS